MRKRRSLHFHLYESKKYCTYLNSKYSYITLSRNLGLSPSQDVNISLEYSKLKGFTQKVARKVKSIEKILVKILKKILFTHDGQFGTSNVFSSKHVSL